MKIYIIFLLAGYFILASSCSNKDADTNPIEQTAQPSNPSSVETNPPNSTYRPAFDRQTRVNAVHGEFPSFQTDVS